MNNTATEQIDLRDRTLEFSRQVIRFVNRLSKTQSSSPIISQLVRSSTSIGANFTEAKNSSSKKDFRNKVYISKKEASETLYWLKLLEEFTGAPILIKLQQECQEIILILQAIINTLGH